MGSASGGFVTGCDDGHLMPLIPSSWFRRFREAPITIANTLNGHSSSNEDIRTPGLGKKSIFNCASATPFLRLRLPQYLIDSTFLNYQPSDKAFYKIHLRWQKVLTKNPLAQDLTMHELNFCRFCNCSSDCNHESNHVHYCEEYKCKPVLTFIV